MQRLISEEYGRQASARIQSDSVHKDLNAYFLTGNVPISHVDDHGTGHFAAIDAEGNAVAVTSTVNTKFALS